LSTQAQLTRGTLLGLTAGAFCGAAMLVIISFASPVKCEGLSETECSFEQQTRRETARLERLGATGLSLLGAGGLFWLRTLSKDRRTS
jgi:hypothetical protein